MLKMKPNVQKLMNEQINKEYFSAYLYLSMSEWLMQNGWIGAAHWMNIQYHEELAHAEGFVSYMQMRGVPIVFEGIDKPKAEWDSLLQVFEEALAHEEMISDSIQKIVEAARTAGDRAAELFLDWYILEQIEEETAADNNVLLIKRADGDMRVLVAVDNEMANRVNEPIVIPHID
ncbi:MAG TPA: ferritin [Clostridiaceae bacterium]|nr:ferritin [Clostridiaceae bacterium]